MLILLDIDGVMVTQNSWKRPEVLSDGFPEFSIKAKESLQKIISETGASILLTTSHKSRFSIVEWNKIFKSRGITFASIKKLQTSKNHLSRKEEILSCI